MGIVLAVLDHTICLIIYRYLRDPNITSRATGDKFRQ